MIYQMKVTLKGSKPSIWRRIQVPGDVTLGRLHDILQAVMDWWGYHLHLFQVGDTSYGVPHPEYRIDMMDERKVRLNEVADEGARFVYEYDFGDSWEHVLQVEKVLEPEPGQAYPVCIKGRRAAPPEDSGGIWMYNFYVEAMENPEHPDYPGDDEYLEWVGDDFDPRAFDLEEINQALVRYRAAHR